MCGYLWNQITHGIEAQPFIAKIARIKTQWNYDLDKFEKIIKVIIEKLRIIRKLKMNPVFYADLLRIFGNSNSSINDFISTCYLFSVVNFP